MWNQNIKLLKYVIFTCIECMYLLGGVTIIPEVHQLLLKDFTFTGIQCTCSWSHKQYSLEYFGTETCWNISFSCVSAAHTIPKANQYSLKYFGTNRHWDIPFLCALIAHITLKAEEYSPKYIGTNCHRNISLSHGFSAHVPQATDNIPWSISALRAAEMFHFHKY